MIWVGKLGPTAIAAVGASGIIIMLISAAMMGFNIGLRAMVARHIGAGDIKGAILENGSIREFRDRYPDTLENPIKYKREISIKQDLYTILT